MTELWRPVSGFENLYLISNIGRVKTIERLVKNRFGYRTAREQIRKSRADKDGYLHIWLSKDGKCFNKNVARLVAEAFIGAPPDRHSEVNHKDENVRNNRVSNLEWCNRFYNNNYGTRNIRVSLALSKPVVAFNDSSDELHFNSMADAKRLGYSASKICLCCQGKRKHHKGYSWKYTDQEEK